MPWVNRMQLQVNVVTRRLVLPLALLLGACSDATAPLDRQPQAPAPTADLAPWSGQTGSTSNTGWWRQSWSTGIPTLRQAATAPPLETYRLTFVVSRWHASSVTVNYLPTGDQKIGQPFLSFYIPKTGLLAGASGAPLGKNDSLTITLTIDPVNFDVDFQPSGVLFSTTAPAVLTLWYENADPDCNGDGVVDSTDQALQQQLTFYYQLAGGTTWAKQPTKNDPTMPSVTSALYHFSEYAVSW